MINDIYPEFVSLALGFNITGMKLTEDHLKGLKEKVIAKDWVGTRAAAYDGFPTLGPIFTKEGQNVLNARTTTHLGSGGVSFGPICVRLSRESTKQAVGGFVSQILEYTRSTRSANVGISAHL